MQPECPLSVVEWISKICSIHAMEYYTAIKARSTNNWMNLENIMIRRSQSQKHIHCIIHLNEIIRISPQTQKANRAWACTEVRERGVSANGLGAALGDETIKLTVAMVARLCKYTKTTEFYSVNQKLRELCRLHHNKTTVIKSIPWTTKQSKNRRESVQDLEKI